ncbi:MAG: bifunctional diguanylate cyclase/phosphodiesterase [Campylobacter sp.]|nr:bifunctional diguanylate cyclase/phosphodiesterase [Campylobacter sp.]
MEKYIKYLNFKYISFSVLGILFVLYAVAIYYEIDSWANLFSMLITFSVTFVIARQLTHAKIFKAYWLTLWLGVFSWAFADMMYILKNVDIVGYDNYMHTFYAIPVVFFFIGFALLGLDFLKRIDITQAYVDIITSMVIAIALFIAIISGDNFFEGEIENARFIYNIIYIFIDVFMFPSVFFLFISIKNLKSYKEIYYILLAFIVYVCTDTVYTFGDIGGFNYDNEYIELLYVLTFYIFAYASFYIKEENDIKYTDSSVLVITQKIAVIILMPLLKLFINDIYDVYYVVFVVVCALLYSIISLNFTFEGLYKKLLEKERNKKENILETIKERSAQVKSTNIRLNRLRKYDYLTKAFNRPYFINYLNEMTNTLGLGERISLYNIDINHFKAINDSYGQYIGDEVLIQLVGNLQSVLPKNAAMSRFSGDDIMIVTKNHRSENDYSEFIENLIRAIKKPIHIDNKQIILNAKIGIGFSDISTIKVEDLISEAQAALNKAKESKQIYAVYNSELADLQTHKNTIKMLLDTAKFDSEFKLVYQPQYDIKNKKLIGAEALLRWISPVKGYISPVEFIPVAEQGPVMVSIGKWVSNKAVEKISYINNTYNTNLKISINLSPKQIDSVYFAEKIQDLLKQHNSKNEWACFEITEMSWMYNDEVIRDVLTKFKRSNIDVALDDFGTGFSSLGYISKYSIDKLKIAKEFVDNIATSVVEKDVVKAIIVMAKTLGIKTIAEGVETEEQLEVLRQIGCDELQGFIWGKPLSEEDFEALVKKEFCKDNEEY